MLRKEDVNELYGLILDRKAESEEVINEKRQAVSLLSVSLEMFASDEFIQNNQSMIKKTLNTSI